MKHDLGMSGLIFNEPLLWEQGATGRTGFSMPERDVDPAPLDEDLRGPGPDFPDLSELEVVRHFTRMSQWNFGVDSGFYPLTFLLPYQASTPGGLPGKRSPCLPDQ